MADGQNINAGLGVLARKLARARGASVGFGLDIGGSFGNSLQGGAFQGDALQGIGMSDLALSVSPPPDPHLRAWRLALARAARDQLKMTVGFADLTVASASLTEVLECPMQRALILMLQGRGETMGLMIISGQMLAAMIEILTLTHLAPDAPDAADLRKPTRTDAAMAVEFVDAALAGFEAILAENGAGAGGDWAAGYRYAAFIEDPRPLHLMLEEGDYHLLHANLALEDGTRTGDVYLALPAASDTGALPDFGAMDFAAPLPDLAPIEDTFQADLAAKLQEMAVQLDANLTQISVPLERVMRLQVGEVLALPMASLDRISLSGLNGVRVAEARLGQNRGMRALRLSDMAGQRPAAGGRQEAGPSAALQAAGMPHSLGTAGFAPSMFDADPSLAGLGLSGPFAADAFADDPLAIDPLAAFSQTG